jgi:hypothetical protein
MPAEPAALAAVRFSEPVAPVAGLVERVRQRQSGWLETLQVVSRFTTVMSLRAFGALPRGICRCRRPCQGGGARWARVSQARAVTGSALKGQLVSCQGAAAPLEREAGIAMFTVGQRDALRDRVLRLAEEDDRVVAAAVVGSLAVAGGGDRFSDLDLTFGIADTVPVADVLDDWTTRLAGELGAVTLAGLERGLTTYRVLLFLGALQLDLSMTPAAEFRPYGPRLRLVFGQTAADEPGARRPPGNLFIDTPAVAEDIFGWGVIYALHTRACIERRRVWQAGHYVGAVRESRALAGLPAPQCGGSTGTRL